MKFAVLALTLGLSTLNSMAFVLGEGEILTSCNANYDQSANFQCVTESFITSSFNPTIPILDHDITTNDAINVELIAEYLDETSQLNTTKQVAKYLEITPQEVLNAVNFLYQYSDVNVEKIRKYYNL